MLGNYSYLLLIVIIGFFIFREYKGLNKFLYVKFRQAYREYQKCVLIDRLTYDNYIWSFINGNHFITGESSRELNKKNIELNILFDLLTTGRELVDKYFSMKNFSYKDYKNLRDEWTIYKYNKDLTEEGLIIQPIIENTTNGVFLPKKTQGRPADKRLLPEMLSEEKGDVNKLLTNIECILSTKKTILYIACLKIALEEEKMISECSVAAFHNALRMTYENVQIVKVRGVQSEYSRLTTILENGKYLKNIGDERKCIDGLKHILSN